MGLRPNSYPKPPRGRGISVSRDEQSDFRAKQRVLQRCARANSCLANRDPRPKLSAHREEGRSKTGLFFYRLVNQP